MKRLILIVAYSLLASWPQPANAQDPAWAVGDHLISFPTADEPTLQRSQLPTPNFPGIPSSHQYDGAVAQRTQNVQMDEQGGLLFFVVDGRVYNGDGLLIADTGDDESDRSCQVCFIPGDEFHVLPVPGSCTRFYLVALHIKPLGVGSEQATSMRMGILDVTLDSDLPAYQGVCVPVKGRFMNAWEQFGEYNLDDAPGWQADAVIGEDVPLVQGDPGPHYLWEGIVDTFNPPFTIRGASIEMEGGSLYLLMLRASQRLFAFFFHDYGIGKDPGPSIGGGYDFVWETATFPPQTIADVRDQDDSYRGQLTLHRSGSELYVAHSSYLNNVVPGFHQTGATVWKFGVQGSGNSTLLNFTPLPNGANPRLYALDGYPIVDPPLDQFGDLIQRPAVSGLQFSPDGSKLYFVKSANYEYWYPPGSGPNGPGVASTFGYIDLNWAPGSPGTYHHYLPIASPMLTSILADTQIFTNVGGDASTPALYMTAHELDVDQYRRWLAVFPNPDVPDAQAFQLLIRHS